MRYMDFALAIYPQIHDGRDGPYDRNWVLREQEWGLLKVLLGTSFAYLEDDIRTLSAPVPLHVNADEGRLVKVYRSERLRWESRYPEHDRIVSAVREISALRGICTEFVGVCEGRMIINDKRGTHSNLVNPFTTIKVNL